HGDPVLHPGRQFPDARRRGQADDLVCHESRGALVRGACACWHRRLRHVRFGVRLERRDRRGDRFDHLAGDGQAGLSGQVWRRRDHHRGLARHSDAPVDPQGDLRHFHQHFDRRAVRGWALSWNAAHRHAVHSDLVPGEKAQLSAHAQGQLGAAMAAVYAFFISVYVYKDLTLKDVPRVLLAGANLSAMLLYIITNAVLFSFLMAHENIPQAMGDWIIGKDLGVVAFLLFVNLTLLLAGNVMEPSSIILIFAPILHPAAMRLGIDSVHLGILIDANMEVGLCHPPVGLNLYV